MKITIWSDIACPFCYIGHEKLRKALAETGMADKVEIRLRAYELNPEIKKGETRSIVSLFEAEGLSADEAKKRIDKIEKLAASEGLQFDFLHAVGTNTRDAHRLLKLVLKKAGPEAQGQALTLLFKAYFEQRRDVASEDVQVGIGEAVGLEQDEIVAMLHSNNYVSAVERDEEAADAANVDVIPYYIIGNTVVKGVVKDADLKSALLKADADDANSEVLQGDLRCGSDGCQL